MEGVALQNLLRRLREQAESGALRVTQHAHEEMVEEDFLLDDVLQAISGGEILESYPEHRRGACCLVGGYTLQGRPLHVVCATGQPLLIVITVYEPKLPKWLTPRERNRR